MLHCHVYGLCWRELAVVLVWHSLTFSHLVWDLTVSLSFSVTHTEGLTVYITAFMYCLQHVFPCFMIFIVLFICTAFILFFILNFSLLSVATCDTNALARDRESKRGKVMCSMGKWAFNLITSISWIQVRILIFYWTFTHHKGGVHQEKNTPLYLSRWVTSMVKTLSWFVVLISGKSL